MQKTNEEVKKRKEKHKKSKEKHWNITTHIVQS
jgi:adenosyl cobinamide kinase/adenosyl cobinamide phosphate guanylyltransferase